MTVDELIQKLIELKRWSPGVGDYRVVAGAFAGDNPKVIEVRANPVRSELQLEVEQ